MATAPLLHRRDLLRAAAGLAPALAALAALTPADTAQAADGDATRPAVADDGFLSASQRRTLAAVAATLLGAEGAPDGLPDVATARVVPFLEELFPRLPEPVRDKVPLLLFGIEHGTRLFGLHLRGFSSLAPADRAAYLAGYAESRFAARRMAFRALKNLVALAYYSADATWPAIGYDGPWIARGITPEAAGHPARAAQLEGHAGLVEGRSLAGDHRLAADVVVIGTGAGGAPLGHALAAAGREVLFLEAGPFVPEHDMTQRVPEMVARLYWDRGARVTRNGAFTVSQGRCVGGSTVHYTAWAMRPPRPVTDRWRYELGIADLDPGSLEALVADAEGVLGTRPVAAEEVNAHNRLVKRGAERDGKRGGLVHHNRIGCIGCGYCLLGCAYGRKQTMANTYLPRALVAGARIVSDAHVERILTRGARATGVRARLLGRDGTPHGTLTVDADVVVVAAGAIHSPVLLRLSGIADSSGELGRNLVFHTTTTLFGLFDEDVNAHRGFTPSFVVDHYLDLERAPDRGYYLVPAFAPPAAIAPFLPGVGAAHASLMRRYPRLAGISVLLHDRSRGTVTTSPDGAPVIDYALDGADQRELVEGMIAAGRVLFGAGAREVYASTTVPTRFASIRDLTQLWQLGRLENRVALNTPHPQGTCRMGGDRRTSVVDPWGQTHDVANVYVSDTSTFPTSLAAPPSMTAAALALRTARHILARG